ncbi:MAG: hypothetical protein LBS03_00625 [Bacteroidales bacterium]|jgi:hypothetical protein|nr:hypothetical protein [Bacteroidales bacterium]
MKRRSKIYFFVYFFIVCCITGKAQSIQVNARLDTTVILIGDQITLHVEVEKENDVRVAFPRWGTTLSPHIEVLAISQVDSVFVSKEIARFSQDLLVTSFDSGRHELPSLSLPYSINGRIDTIRTMPLYLDVQVMPTDTLKNIADIKPIYRLPIGWKDIYPWLLLVGMILVGLALVGFAVYVIVRKRRHQPVFGLSSAPAEQPHVIALRELDKLRNEKLWQRNQTKEYYTRLTDIVRTYIDGRFGVNAMEMTSEEILEGMEKNNFEDNNLMNRLKKLLSLSDLVKFAKIIPLPDENETSILDGYLFVNNTKVETIEASEQPGGQAETDIDGSGFKHKGKSINTSNV